MDKKICIITGANSGIGKQAAIQIASAGYHVVLGCRNRERGQKALEEVLSMSQGGSAELLVLDLSLRASTTAFAEAIKAQYDHVDVLIHNAAVFDVSQKERRVTEEGYECVWMTNHVNPVYLTYALLDLLKASDNGRVIHVSSKGLLAMPFLKVSLEDPEYKHRTFSMTKAYYQSKRAQVMWTYYLADALKDTHVSVNVIRVPAVQVDLSRHPDITAFTKWVYKQKSKQAITPQAMAKTYTYLATDEEVASMTGKCFNEHNRIVTTSGYSRHPDHIEAVMKLTKEYL